MFAADRLGYAYLDRFPALVDVSLTIRPGERVALLGANGCGKSTLLKVLAGLVHPHQGSLSAFGVPLTEESLADEHVHRSFRSRVGFVFQNSEVQLFSATVREEVAFGTLQLGLDRPEVAIRVSEVLALLGLTDLADRAPFQLSGGQRKRVALASVLVMNPPVLLLDEPTAALDPRTADWLTDLLHDLTEAGRTIVLATHDLGSLESLVDRAVVLGEDHRVVADAPVAQVVADRDLLRAVNLIGARDERRAAP